VTFRALVYLGNSDKLKCSFTVQKCIIASLRPEISHSCCYFCGEKNNKMRTFSDFIFKV